MVVQYGDHAREQRRRRTRAVRCALSTAGKYGVLAARQRHVWIGAHEDAAGVVSGIQGCEGAGLRVLGNVLLNGGVLVGGSWEQGGVTAATGDYAPGGSTTHDFPGHRRDNAEIGRRCHGVGLVGIPAYTCSERE